MRSFFSTVLLLSTFIIRGTSLQAQVNTSDSLALVDLYDNNNGDQWGNAFVPYPWNKNSPVTTWGGISINNSRVVKITMYGNKYLKVLPPSFAYLDSLKAIDFTDNALDDDCFTTITNLVNLTSLRLSAEHINGPLPAAIGNLTRLVTLDFQNCSAFGGLLPAALGNLAELDNFDIGYNAHDGHIPANELSELPFTVGFGLNNNRYTFKEIEPLVEIFKGKNKENKIFYASQNDISTLQRNDELYVSAGGTLAYNSYKWYKAGTGLVATKNGDSTYRPLSPGTYYAEINNAIATQLTLKSLPLKAAAAMVAACPDAGAVLITSDQVGSSYQWQESIDSVNYYDVHDDVLLSGTNTRTLQLSTVSPSYYGRKYRCVANTGISTSFTIYFPNSWVGASTSNWEDAANWSCGSVPGATTDVIINSGSVMVNSNITIKSLYLGPAVIFTVAPGYTVTINP